MDAKPAPQSSIVSVVGALFTELGLLAVYAMMFALTLVVVSGSSIVYAILAIPGALTRASVDEDRVLMRERSSAALWHANPSSGRR